MIKTIVVLVSSFFLILATIASASTIQLPQTGQISCCSSSGTLIPCTGTGQDGEFRAGVVWPNPRFIVNGDCVTDKLTGLMWLKSPDTTARTWTGALDYVDDYVNGLQLCGYTDWRLPNVNELESLVNAEQANSAEWLGTQGFSSVSGGSSWSSTTSMINTFDPWFIDMLEGYVYNDSQTSFYLVWPVRGGQSGTADQNYPANIWKTGQTTSYYLGDDGALQKGVSWPASRFTDNGNGTITDNLTGLIWLKNANCIDNLGGIDKSSGSGYLTWTDALTWSNNLANGPCGLTDGTQAGVWRLPNRKELMSLIDWARYDPALPLNHPFINVQWDSYWSSSSRATDPHHAWYVSLAGGIILYNSKEINLFSLPVRSYFADIPSGFWAYSYIYAIYNAGITTGYQDGTYRPSLPVSRAAMAALIIRAKFGENFSYSSTPYFTDVQPSNQFFKYIQKMRDEGITTGCTPTEYCPSSNVSRQGMAAFIIRAKFGEDFAYTPTPFFTDVPPTNQFFKYIQKMKDEGITTGCTATEYCLNGYVTRAAMAAFLARAFPQTHHLSLSLNPAALPVATLYTTYNQSISMTASGGVSPYNYSCSGSGVFGLTASANGNTCTISGTPTVSGTYTVNFAVTDSANTTVSMQLVISLYIDLQPAWNGAYYLKQLRYVQIGAHPAQRFYRVILPTQCQSGVQLWLAGSILNVNMLLSNTDFGTEAQALSVYQIELAKSGQDTGLHQAVIDGKTYWYNFAGSPESESVDLSGISHPSILYVEVVNEYTYAGTYNIEVDCW